MDNLAVHQQKLENAEKKGREEEKLKIAVKLLSKGTAIEDIADITSLSFEQIKEIESKF